MTPVEELRQLVARGLAAVEGRPDDWPGMGGLADEKIAEADAGLRGRVALLADRWDGDHADWCCTLGCSTPDGRHLTNETARALLAAGVADVSVPIETVPCPGACTCETGPRVADLRAALTPTADTTPSPYVAGLVVEPALCTETEDWLGADNLTVTYHCLVLGRHSEHRDSLGRTW